MYAALNLDTIGRNLAHEEYRHLFKSPTPAVSPNRAIGEPNSSLEPLERLHMVPYVFQRMAWGTVTLNKEFTLQYNRKKKKLDIRLEVQLGDSFEATNWSENSPKWAGSASCLVTAGFLSQWATRYAFVLLFG